MKTRFIGIGLVTMFFLTGLVSCQKPEQENLFVRVDGDHFTSCNSIYAYIGANFWEGAWLAAAVRPGGKERLERELDNMKKNGITNLRVMASAEKSDVALSLTPVFQNKPGVYDTAMFKGFDLLLSEMAKRNMHAVMMLNNYWTWTGGMPQYVNWSTGEPVPDPAKTHDWPRFLKYSASFYSDTTANRIFRNYIEEVVTRKNSITGIEYNDDPTIMAWELANEPRPDPRSLTDSTYRASFLSWINSTAEYIHSLAPHQLVTTGSEGTIGTLNDMSLTRQEQSFPSIDYITIHIWPKNWGWYYADKAEQTFGPSVTNTFKYLDQHLALAKSLNKPLVIEEFGLPRDGEQSDPSSPVTFRNKYYGMIFDTLVANVRAGSPLSGANFWAWGGEGRAHTPDYTWKAGIDFTGDPPPEAQGLNSVFDTDSTTIAIIREHAKALNR